MSEKIVVKKFSSEKTAFFSTILIGLFAHGYILTHNLILHDNTYNFYLGATYPFGRWMIEIVTRFTNALNNTYLHFSTPLYLGVIAIIYIAAAAVLLTRLFDIKDKYSIVALSGIMVSFPMVTSLMGFMFMSAVNMLGMLLAVLGAYIVCKYKKWYSFIAGIILMTCGVGIYQAYIAVFVSIFLIFFMYELNGEKTESPLKSFFKGVAYYGGACVATLISYLLMMKFFLWHYNTELTSYQGMDSAASTTVSQYLSRIAAAYKEFINPVSGTTRCMYQGGARYLYYITIILAVLVTADLLYKLISGKKYVLAGLELVLFALLPLAVNFVYVMCDVNVHSVMMYGEVFLFVYVIVFSKLSELKKPSFPQFIVPVCMFVLVLLNCRFSNICYLRGEYVQNASAAYFNRMVSRIESTQGYDVSLPVAFDGYGPSNDENLFVYPEFTDTVNIYPFSLSTVINNYNWQTFMKVTTGYNPDIVDIEEIKDPESIAAIESMPSYPNEGSIAVIDGIIVIKF